MQHASQHSDGTHYIKPTIEYVDLLLDHEQWLAQQARNRTNPAPDSLDTSVGPGLLGPAPHGPQAGR